MYGEVQHTPLTLTQPAPMLTELIQVPPVMYALACVCVCVCVSVVICSFVTCVA